MGDKFCELWPLFAKLNLRRPRGAALGFAFDRQHLTSLIIAARRANGVTGDSAAALWALAKLRPMPTVGCFARAQPHLRGFAFRDSHASRLEKQSLPEIQMRFHFFTFNLSSALQSGFRFVSGDAASDFVNLQTLPPSRSQRGWAGRFSKMSSRMNGPRSTVSGP